MELLNIYGREITEHIRKKQFLMVKYLVEDMYRYFDEYPDILGRANGLAMTLEMECTMEVYDTMVWIQRRVQEEDIFSFYDDECDGCCGCD